MLADPSTRDMSSPGWLRRFAGLKEEYVHHAREEAQEQFAAAEGRLSERDLLPVRKVFEQRNGRTGLPSQEPGRDATRL